MANIDNQYLLESLQAVIASLHAKGQQSAIYHLTNLLQGHTATLDNEHLFVHGGVYWVTYQPKTFWRDSEINVHFEKV